jgi:uncharacterized membrane-anchored protein YhcB (DUF1043 family)
MFNLRPYSDTQEVINEMLRNKKGVCMHFSFLLDEIGKNLGIKSYIIFGYTKQNGEVLNLPHAWCASFIDSKWQLIDPTWGAGYVMNNKYVRELSDNYFMVSPENLIRSHIPYDPLWQFLNYPVTKKEFQDGFTEINIKKPFFNFLDTLWMYENSTKMEQLIATNRRILQNGVRNSFTKNQIESNKSEIESFKYQIVVDFYNSAANIYNDGIIYLNDFIDYRNNQFIPQKSETEIRWMIENAENALIDAQNELQKISTTDKNLLQMMKQLQSYMKDANVRIKEQKSFINQYFNTKK